MTYDAGQIARSFMIAATSADGGCSHCATQVLEDAVRYLPDLPWRAAWEDMKQRDPEEMNVSWGYFTEMFEENTDV